MARLLNFRAVLENLTDEERKELEAEGYNLMQISATLTSLAISEQQRATIKASIETMKPNIREALEEVTLALSLDSGPEYRRSCQNAFMRLLDMDTYSSDDIALVKKILRLGE